MPCDGDQVSFAKLLNALADRACDSTVAAKVTADIADGLAGANCVGIPGCVNSNLAAALLNTHKQLSAIAIGKCL
jgi:hypothetical protein